MAQEHLKYYLRVFMAMVFAIIFIGGITRLTRSGLSITEWNVVSGILPPSSEVQWQRSFDLYKATPEFQKLNSHFSLADYQNIFFWEWLHRIIARLIFLWAAAGGLIIYLKHKRYLGLVSTLSVLVGLQGVLGWVMVRSGLQRDPHVSPFLLALHFISALGVAGYAHYHHTQLRSPLAIDLSSKERFGFYMIGVLLFLQIFYGCLVGGLKAGFMYNTYPLMAGDFLPSGAFYLKPWPRNFLENPVVVQWIHRWLGVVFFIWISGVAYWLLQKAKHKPLRLPMLHLLGIVLFQIILGAIVLLSRVQVGLAAFHQLCGAAIVLSYLGMCFRFRKTNEVMREY